MKAKSAKAKGKRGEMEVVNLLRESGIDKSAMRDPGSGGGNREKSDIINSLNYNMEVKWRENLNIWKAIEQVETYSNMNHAIPSVFFRRSRMNEWWVAIPFSEWGKLMKSYKGPKTPSNNREFYWDLNNLKNAIRKVTKHIKE